VKFKCSTVQRFIHTYAV